MTTPSTILLSYDNGQKGEAFAMVGRGRHPKKEVADSLDLARKAGMAVTYDKNGHRWGWVSCPACGRTRLMYEFDLNLNQALTDEQELAVLEHMTDEISVVRRHDGTGYLMCAVDDGDAPSFPAAVACVAVQLHTLIPARWATGLVVDDTVSLSETARRAGSRTKQSLRLLATGERGPGGFPAPVIGTGSHRLYSWAAIAEYLRALGDAVPQVDTEIMVMDRVLAARAAVHAARLTDSFWTEATRDVVAA